MSASKDVSEAKPRFYPLDESVCVACSRPLRYEYKTSGRYVFDLDDTWFVESQAGYCTNGRCPLVRRTMHPPGELFLAPSGERFSCRVIATIGQLRFGEKLTRSEISNRLLKEHNLRISERQVNRYFELYGALVSGQSLEDKGLIAELKKNRGVVLSLDAAEPMKGHELVWIIRDLLSGRALLARSIRSSTEDDLITLLEPVKVFLDRHKIPLTAVLSDAEKNIRGAVARVFPRAKHQLCQIHYVNNLSKPVEPLDRELRKELRAPFRQLRQFERDIKQAKEEIGSLTEDEADVMADLCLMLQSVLKDSGKLPFEPPGQRLYQALLELRDTVTKMSREKGGPV